MMVSRIDFCEVNTLSAEKISSLVHVPKTPTTIAVEEVVVVVVEKEKSLDDIMGNWKVAIGVVDAIP